MNWDEIRKITDFLGIESDTFHQWKKRGYIPPAKHYVVARAALELGVELTIGQLVSQYEMNAGGHA